jgi:hypothetical protein
MHKSHPSETHYFSLTHSSPQALLHTHGSGPYISDILPRGLNLVIYSSTLTNCVTNVDVQVDWWSTLGRLGSRYPLTVLSWTVGVVALVLFGAWEDGNQSSEYFCFSLHIVVGVRPAG